MSKFPILTSISGSSGCGYGSERHLVTRNELPLFPGAAVTSCYSCYYHTLHYHIACLSVVGKSQIESPKANLKSLYFKSQIWEGKSQISNRRHPNQIKSPNFKSQIFSKSPKTDLLPQKIRRTTMQLIEKVVIFDGNLVFMWPYDYNTQ